MKLKMSQNSAILVSCVFLLQGCISYHGISKHGNEIYITGSTNFFGISQPWVKKCWESTKEDGSSRLICIDSQIDTAQATLTKEDIREFIAERSESIQRCTETANLPSDAKVEANITILNTGIVSNVEFLDSGFAASAPAACIAQKIKKIQFTPIITSKVTHTIKIPITKKELPTSSRNQKENDHVNEIQSASNQGTSNHYLDSKTSFAWQRIPFQQEFSLPEALAMCSTLNLSGYSYKIPTISNILTLSNTQASKEILLSAFPKGSYWAYANETRDQVVTIDLHTGTVIPQQPAYKNQTICVGEK